MRYLPVVFLAAIAAILYFGWVMSHPSDAYEITRIDGEHFAVTCRNHQPPIIDHIQQNSVKLTCKFEPDAQGRL